MVVLFWYKDIFNARRQFPGSRKPHRSSNFLLWFVVINSQIRSDIQFVVIIDGKHLLQNYPTKGNFEEKIWPKIGYVELSFRGINQHEIIVNLIHILF